MKTIIVTPSVSLSLSALLLGATVLAACDPGVDAELDDVEASADDLAETGDEAESDDEVDPDAEAELPDVEIEALADDVDPEDPSEVYSGWVGGFGGTQYTDHCGWGLTAIGIAAAPSPNGQLVRQLAIVCGLEAEIEAGHAIPPGGQTTIATGYWNGSFAVAPTYMPRLEWDATVNMPGSWRYKAPGSQYFLCDPGYRLDKIDVRAGAMVDRIDGMTCWWDGPGSQGPRGLIYSISPGVGGWGGSYANASCQGTGERFVDGIRFRSGAVLDGFQVDCLE